MTYRHPLSNLVSDSHLRRESLRLVTGVFAVGGQDPPSLALLVDRRRHGGESLEAYIVTACPDDGPELVGAIRDARPAKFVLDDMTVAAYVTEAFDVVNRGYQTSLRFDLTVSDLEDLAATAPVVRLGGDHESLAGIEQHVSWNWQWCMEDRTASSACFGVLRDGVLASFCAIGPDEVAGVGEPFQEVAWVWTAEGFRRRGLGKAVLAQATRFALDRGAAVCYSCDDDNGASLATALSRGYREIGRTNGTRAGLEADRALMEGNGA